MRFETQFLSSLLAIFLELHCRL